MATRVDGDDVATLALRGLGTLSPGQGVAAIERLFDDPSSQVAVLPVDWRAWQRQYPSAASAALLAELIDATDDSAMAAPSLSRDLVLAAADDGRHRLVQEYLHQQTARALRLAPAELDDEQSIAELGLDSLMSVELKNGIERDLAVVIPMVTLLEGPSIVELTSQVLRKLMATSNDSPCDGGLTRATSAQVSGHHQWVSREQAEDLLAQLDQLPDERVDALLASLLEAPGA
jgi:acyl carrier protein